MASFKKKTYFYSRLWIYIRQRFSYQEGQKFCPTHNTSKGGLLILMARIQVNGVANSNFSGFKNVFFPKSGVAIATLRKKVAPKSRNFTGKWHKHQNPVNLYLALKSRVNCDLFSDKNFR